MSAGGGISLTETVKVVYSIDVRDDRYWLDAAVLLRSTRPWPLSADPPPLRPGLPPLGPGGGGSAGRHHIFVDHRDKVVWIDRSLRLSLNDFNGVMLDRADDPVDLPIMYGMFMIDPDLGAAPSDSVAIAFAIRFPVQQLKRSLEESARVRAFLYP